MEIQGKIISKGEIVKGQGSKGEWKKQEFVIQTDGQYPKKVCVAAWGGIVDELAKYKVGESVSVFFDLESREYNGRWYTEVKAWKLGAIGAKANPKQEAPLEIEDDLPF